MGLKLTLFTTDEKCDELIQVEIYHFSNFKGENEFHMSNDSMVELAALLIRNKIPFKTNYSSLVITGDVRIRLDNITAK